MFVDLLVPAFVTAVATLVTIFWRHQLSPRLAATWATALTVTAALAFIWSEFTILIGALGHAPGMVAWLGWCRDIYRPDDAVPPVAGVLAALGLVAGTVGLLRTLVRERRALRAVPPSSEPVQLIESDDLFAFAAPGRPGRVVVSRAMLDALTPSEQTVMFAHEESHLAHRHHRFRVAAAMAAAAVPPLRLLADQVTYATERWADEDAVGVVGDRRLVAKAIGRAALASSAPGTYPAMAGSSVLARVEAVLEPQAHQRLRSVTGAAALAVLAVAVVGSTAQLHHLISFVFHVCNR